MALLVALAPLASRGEDPLHAGPIYDQFRLTLAPGHRTEALGPLFYDQDSDTQRTWAVPPAVSDTVDPSLDLREFDIFYPVLSYDRYGSQYRWQFCEIFSLAGGPSQNAEIKNRFTIFPVYFQQRSSNPDLNYTAVAPFYGHLKHRLFRDEIYFVMFPMFAETRKRDVITDNYLFPFFHLRHGPGLEGWQLWPLTGHEHKVVTTRTNGFNDVVIVPGHDSRFVLWPIYFNDYSGLGTTNEMWEQAVLPLYALQRSPLRDSTTVLWPFFSRIDDREKQYREWDAPWPLIEFAHGSGKTTRRVWPFFSRSHSPTLEDNFYLWPVYKYSGAHLPPLDRARRRILFFLAGDTVDKNTETQKFERLRFCWPFFLQRREFNGNWRLQVLAPLEPFVLGSHKIERDWSPLWSIWRAEKNPNSGAASQSLLWNLYRRQTSPRDQRLSAFFGLFQSESGAEGRQIKLFYVPVVNRKRGDGLHATASGSDRASE